MANGGVSWDDKALLLNLRTFNARADRAITAAIGFHATKATSFARKNAPWTDRTTNARNGLFALPVRRPPFYRIIIGHSVPYGIWLEVRWAGRYAIIRPTVEHEGPELMKTVSQMYGQMFRR